MLKLHGGYINKVPVLYTALTHENYAKLKRVTYAALQSKQRLCFLPAYAPMLATCLTDVDNIFGGCTIDEKGTQIVEDYYKKVRKYEAGHIDPTFTFAFKPFAHQLQSLLDIIYNHRWNLSLDPGLGKTKIIIDYLRYLKLPALILAPASLLENWVDEFKKHDPKGERKVIMFGDGYKSKREQVYDTKGEPVRVNGKLKKKVESAAHGKARWLKDLDKSVDVLLIGYHSAAEYRKAIMAYYEYDVIVLDESHRIKGFKAKNSEGARELSQRAARRITMSGTYLLNSPVDAWPQLDFLSPQILNQQFYSFREKYCTFHEHYRHQVVGYQNLHTLNKIISRFSTRYTKEDAVKSMPKRMVIKRYFNLTAEQTKWYDDVLSEDDLKFDDGIILKEHKVVLLGKLAQICRGYVHLSNKDPAICDGCDQLSDCVANHLKPYTKTCSKETIAPEPTKRHLKSNPALEALKELLDELLGEPQHKVIIWCKGVEEQEFIKQMLDADRTKYVQVTDAQSTISKVRMFNETKDVRVLLSSIAKGIGYTANSAQFSIYFSLGFSLEHYHQSRDRNYRLNTPHPVWEYHILGRNSIDIPTLEALEFKKDVVDSLLDASTCDLCLRKNTCNEGGIQKFKKGCKFKNKVSRTTIDTTGLGG